MKKKLQFLYDRLTRSRFGFFTGTFMAYLALCFFIVCADYAGFLYEDTLIFVIEMGSKYVCWVFVVRFAGVFYRHFMVRRSCTVDGEPEETATGFLS